MVRMRPAARACLAFVSVALVLAIPTAASAPATASMPAAASPPAARPDPVAKHPAASPFLIAGAPRRAAIAPPSAESFRIRLRSGFAIDPRLGEPALPDGLRGFRGPEDGARAYLVHYGDSDPEAVRASIRAAGGRIVAYVPERTFVVRVPASSSLSLEGARSWVGLYQPAYKLSPRLDLATADAGVADVLLFPDGDAERVSDWVRAAGGEVIDKSANDVNTMLRVRLAGDQLGALAQDADVAWVEPRAEFELSNAEAQWVTQTGTPDSRRLWSLGLHGENQVVMTSDTGVDTGHDQFREPTLPIGSFGDYPSHRKLIAYQLGSASTTVRFGDHGRYHGTHTAGTVAGSDDGYASSALDGVAKGARLYFMDLAGPLNGNSVVPFTDLNDLFLPSYLGNAGGAARISSNSWGNPVRGDYDLSALAVDQFTWNHPDYLIFFSAGNSSDPGTVSSPASAKSVVTVGGVGNGALSNVFYGVTSRGPTTDGRRKPTLVAPAQGVTSANAAPNHYATLSGTSMACPAAAGTAALMRQYCTEGWYPTGTPVAANGFAPSAALLKAMCVGSATDRVTGYHAPDQNIGYGRIDADNVLAFWGDAQNLLLEDFGPGLGHRQSIEYRVTVTDASMPLVVSLCWTDYPGNPAAAVQLVNDLDLTVTNGDESYLGNVYASGASVAGGRRDSLNVEEAVRIAAPRPGMWKIRVEGVNVPMGPEPFGLCVTGGVGGASGAMALDRASYGSAGTVVIKVADANAGSEVAVTVRSGTEPAGERVRLAGAHGLYRGTLRLTPLPSPSGDGRLQVSNGDAIVATYADPAPPATLTASATARFDPPRIGAVGAASRGAASASVWWKTDQSADSRVYYGPTPALGLIAADSTAALDHRVTLSGLAIGSTYYFDVESQDLNGNPTRDDNGGAHYRVTAEPSAHLLLVLGAGDFALARRYEEALRDLGWSCDVWSGAAAENPELGDATRGMRSYRAVWWQAGPESYPPFTEAARRALSQYLEDGGRLAVVGHDIAWALGDPGSPFGSAESRDWLKNTLHSIYRGEPSSGTGIMGIAADPISGGYLEGLPYVEHRPGAAGDKVDHAPGAGSESTVWLSGDGVPRACAIRWQSGDAQGATGASLWAGTPSRLMALFFEWTGLRGALDSSPERTDVMRRSLVWLMGRDRPQLTLISPSGGDVVTSDSLTIRWAESYDRTVGAPTRMVEYSTDDGQSWITIAANTGSGPLRWDLRSVPNTAAARVRVRLTDGGTPSLGGWDQSHASFAIRGPRGDAAGPRVVAGSIRTEPNPIRNQEPFHITATVSDLAAGAGSVIAAEWSYGDQPAPAGKGHPMSGDFPASTVTVAATLPRASLPLGEHRLFVRGRDQAGNWGAAAALSMVVNGPPPVEIGATPSELMLALSAPNPVIDRAEIAYALPRQEEVRLAIYDVQGRHVRDLVRGSVAAGPHRATWDRTDDRGRRVGSGIYYYRLTAGGRSLQRRMVALR